MSRLHRRRARHGSGQRGPLRGDWVLGNGSSDGMVWMGPVMYGPPWVLCRPRGRCRPRASQPSPGRAGHTHARRGADARRQPLRSGWATRGGTRTRDTRSDGVGEAPQSDHVGTRSSLVPLPIRACIPGARAKYLMLRGRRFSAGSLYAGARKNAGSDRGASGCGRLPGCPDLAEPGGVHGHGRGERSSYGPEGGKGSPSGCSPDDGSRRALCTARATWTAE